MMYPFAIFRRSLVMDRVFVGIALTMKRLLASLATLAFLAVAVPALAQDRDNHDHGGPMMQHGGPPHGGPPPRRYAPPPRRHVYREGQVYNGHHITNRGGHWGYYQPRNGVNVFINIPL
jgi:hypothetical protein